jgi:3-(3-hydroxy-phenyl)propionate hydroxylase
MTQHAVVVAGAGPTGLMLAGELALAHVDVAIVERRASLTLAGSRAGGLDGRTIELLDQRGIADRFLSQGQTYPVVRFHIPLDISDFPTRHPYVLALKQNYIEPILADWVEKLGVPIYRGRDVIGFTQNDAGVDVDVSDGSSLRAAYLVGCDGGRSLVRKTAGIDFPGSEPTMSWMLAEAQMTEEPAWGFRQDAVGTHAIGKADGGQVGVVLVDREVTSGVEPTLRELREALVATYGTDFGVHSPTWLTRFTDVTRQAAAYRKGRVLLAGDAAHVHPPMGGQGLNIGVQDAVNLGWKLAQVIGRASPDSLLDTYHAERHPVGARVLHNTMAQTALRRPDDRSKALGDYVAAFLRLDEPRKRIAAEISGLDVHYDIGEGHPLLGRRMPDLDLLAAGGPTRTYSLLRGARAVLLDLGEAGVLDIAPWGDRVQLIHATYDGRWELPLVGEVPAPAAVLIRPDGYVAWVGDGSSRGLFDAMVAWFGSPTR